MITENTCVKYLVNHTHAKVIKEEHLPYFNPPRKNLRSQSYMLAAPQKTGKRNKDPFVLKAKN